MFHATAPRLHLVTAPSLTPLAAAPTSPSGELASVDPTPAPSAPEGNAKWKPREVFPLHQDTLKPAVTWSTPGPYSIPVNPGDFYGLPTGARNGVFGLDLDVKNNKNGIAVIERYMRENDTSELPETLTVRTKSGGLHMIYALPLDGRRIGNRVGMLEGVDVKGEGGYLNAGGSGPNAYEVEDDREPVQAPEWLLELITAKRDAVAPVMPVQGIAPGHPQCAHRVKMAAEYLASAPVCISGTNGQRQIWLVALMLSRTLELPVEQSMALVADYNARCVPPWDAADWKRTLERAAQHGQTIPGTFSESFLAPASAGTAPSSGRRRRDPTHVYTHDFNESVLGGSLETLGAISDLDLGALFSVNSPDPAWRGVFQWDMFRERLIAVDPPMRLDAETKGLTSRDVTAIRFYIVTERKKLVKDERIRPVIKLAASHNPFHPVRDYLDELPKPSLAEAEAHFVGIAGRVWGAPPELDELESGVFRRFAIGAVRRIRRPGEQVDESPIWYGEQGKRKSSLLRKLFGEFFVDHMPGDLANRDAAHHLIGKWCVEDAELVGHARTGSAVKKAFMTRVEDSYRDYGNGDPIVRPRSCVFAGTTNDEACLSDPSGNRRYNVLAVRKEIDVEAFDRDAFWAAANVLEAAGASHFSNKTEAAALTASRVAYTEVDPWTDEVLACAAKAGARVTAKACLMAVVPDVTAQTPALLKRVQGILRKAFGASRSVNGVSAYDVPETHWRVPVGPTVARAGGVRPSPAPSAGANVGEDSTGAMVPRFCEAR
jgi:virulence-associated protein E/bifunctional DNA primase/polymerase-like protein